MYYNENEFGMTDLDGQYYKYDFTDNVNKVIIEYNGDYWHPKCLNDPDWKNNRLDCNETWIYIMKIKNCVPNEMAIKFTIFGNMMLMNVIVNVYQNVN